jgi:hypothetical protein
VDVYFTEMKWQQRLGQISGSLKKFANRWQGLSWLNFILVVWINIMYIMFITVDEEGYTSMAQPWQTSLVDVTG